jgi:hypothetical protein
VAGSVLAYLFKARLLRKNAGQQKSKINRLKFYFFEILILLQHLLNKKKVLGSDYVIQ